MSERRRDRGFTFVELLVVVVLMGVVATVITIATTVILRNEGPTNTRANESRTLHGLNTWLGRDASSTAAGNFDLTSTTGTNCTTGSPGVNLVRMDWTENTGTAVNYVASYRFVDQGGGEYRVERHTCSGSGPGPYTNGFVQRLTGELSSTTPNVSPELNGASEIIGVSIEVFSFDGASIYVDGDSRNPAETLPATTTTTTTTTPPTTTTTVAGPTTTVAGGACAISTFTATPNPVGNQGNGVKRLSTDVTVNISVTGVCGTLTLQYDRGDGAGVQNEGVTGTSPNFTVILESDNAQQWSEATHPLTVIDGGTPLAPVVNLVVT